MKDSQNMLIAGGFGLALLLAMRGDTKGPKPGGIVYKGSIDFVRKNYPFAKATQDRTKTPAVVNLTFGAVESGWGKHAISNNYHGIKAGKDWKGSTSVVRTPECGRTGDHNKDSIHAEILRIIPPGGSGAFQACTNKGDYTYWINDKFRSYSSPAGSFLDYGYFLQKHYHKAFQFSDPAQFGAYVLTHGYSTAQYVQTFLKLMNGIQEIINTKL